MDYIIESLNNNDWVTIEKIIRTEKIDPFFIVDNINNLVHYMAYHNKTDLIKMINHNQFINIINYSNIEGDTVCHIGAKLKNIDLVNYCILIDKEIIYQKNQLNCTPLFYLVSDDSLINGIILSMKINDHYINDEYTLTEYYVLTKKFEMLEFILDNIKINNLTNNILFTLIQLDVPIELKVKKLRTLQKYSLDLNYFGISQFRLIL